MVILPHKFNVVYDQILQVHFSVNYHKENYCLVLCIISERKCISYNSITCRRVRQWILKSLYGITWWIVFTLIVHYPSSGSRTLLSTPLPPMTSRATRVNQEIIYIPFSNNKGGQIKMVIQLKFSYFLVHITDFKIIIKSAPNNIFNYWHRPWNSEYIG